GAVQILEPFGRRTVVVRGPHRRPALATRARGSQRQPMRTSSETGVGSVPPALETSLSFCVHAFSSRLRSFKKRQSVPSAIIFCGVDLTNPISCKRSAYYQHVSSPVYSCHLSSGSSISDCRA